MPTDGLSLYDILNERDRYGQGPTMAEAMSYFREHEQEMRRERRAALHRRIQEISQRLVELAAVLKVLVDDLDVDFAGADVPGLSLERVRADVRCEETELKREWDELTHDPDYQAA